MNTTIKAIPPNNILFIKNNSGVFVFIADMVDSVPKKLLESGVLYAVVLPKLAAPTPALLTTPLSFAFINKNVLYVIKRMNATITTLKSANDI